VPVILALPGSLVGPAVEVLMVLGAASGVDGLFEEWPPLLPAVLVEEVLLSPEASSEAAALPEAVVLEVVEPVEPAARSFVCPLVC